jgi:trimeric autotransporter adhesin
MKKFTLLLVAGFLVTASFGQISGTFTIPGATYSTIAAAISALNASGVGDGGVTFNVTTDYTETFASPTDGYLTILTSPPTSSNPVLFQKSGEGANPQITSGAGTGNLDAIIAFSGLSYITFDGIDLYDNPANATTTAQMEWGFALLKASGTQGSQHITIKNCKVSLKNTNPLSWGIYSNNHTTAATTQLTVTAATGQNSYNRFNGNTITNSYGGIYLSGYNDGAPYANFDQNNDIGSLSGNTIINFTGGTTDEYLVSVQYQNVLTIANTNINGTGTGTSSIYGIYGGPATNANADIYGNTVSIVQSVATTGTIYGIYIPYTGLGTNGTTNTLNVYNNTVQNCSQPNATTAIFYGIYHFSPVVNMNCYGNLVTNNVIGGSNGCYYCVSYGGVATGTQYVYNNIVSNNQRTGTGTQSATAYVYCLWVQGTCKSFVHDNQIYNNSLPGQVSRSANLYGLYVMPSNILVYNNTVHDQSITSSYTGSNTLYNFYIQPSYHANNAIYNNSVYNTTINLSGTGNGLIYGIWVNNTDQIHDNLVYNLNVNCTSTGYGYGYGFYYNEATAGHTGAIYKNRVYNAKMDGASAYFYGIWLHGGTTVNVYNNYVSDLRLPASSSANGLHGIYVNNPGTVGIYNNTVYLNATSTSTGNFFSDCVFANTTPTLEMRNNILVNLSTAPGSTSYIAAAYRRSTTSLTNYTTSSNNNDFYAGTPSSTNLIFSDGTNNLQTMSAFQSFVAPRETNSFTENPPFINVTTTPYNLHLTPGAGTYCESGGSTVVTPISIVDDYDGDPRYPNAGYPDNPLRPATAPDVGADEFAGGPMFKTLNVSAFLEGLFAGGGQMNKAQDENGDHFAGNTADQITVELHNSGNYGTLEYTSAGVNLTTSGNSTLTLPADKNGSYYLTVKHRNSIETTSASPVDFSGSTINYTFDALSKAYADNMNVVSGTPVIFAGDENQDGIVDGTDLSDIGNLADLATSGYLPQDVNGDGLIDGSDLSIAGNNAALAVGIVTP